MEDNQYGINKIVQAEDALDDLDLALDSPGIRFDDDDIIDYSIYRSIRDSLRKIEPELAAIKKHFKYVK